jgi:hypothetical protein
MGYGYFGGSGSYRVDLPINGIGGRRWLKTMTPADRVTKLASQLLGDLDAVDTAAYDRTTADQQKLQLIAEAFERAGVLALDGHTCEVQIRPKDPASYASP